MWFPYNSYCSYRSYNSYCSYNMAKEKNDNTAAQQSIAQKWGDPYIWGIYFMLLAISVVESYSASSREIAASGIYMPLLKQLVLLAIGVGIVFFMHRIDYDKPAFLTMMIAVLAVFTVVSLVWVIFFGKEINGAQRAIYLPGFTIMPAEFAKLSVVTLLAYILARCQTGNGVSTRGTVLAAIVVAVYGALLIKNGVTNTILLMSISLIMLVIGGIKFKKFLLVFGIFVVCGGVFMLLKSNNDSKDESLKAAGEEVVVTDPDGNGVTVELSPAEQENAAPNWGRFATFYARIDRWMHSEALIDQEIGGKNQQEMFSRMAIAHGGVVGVGLGHSRECSRLPLAFSDYIFSIILEEGGLVLGLFVLLLYLWLLARAAMIVQRSRRVLPALLIIGMASMITMQALFHIAINVGVFPVSGQPLPLISKGGTSTLVISLAFGVMLSISRTIANYSNKTDKVETSSLPDGLDAENPSQVLPRHIWS